MSIQFTVKQIFVLTGPAIGNNHEGEPYANPDFSTGSVFCYDMKDNLYFERYPTLGGEDRFAGYIYSRRKTPVRLFRDYWVYQQCTPGAPYRDAIDAAPRKILFEAK